MLRSGNHPEIFRIVALQTRNERDAHAAGKKRILAISLLPAPPAWIAEDIDIGRPEVEPFHDVPPSSTHCLIVLGPSLSSDHDCHLMDQRIVESGGQSDGLGKNRGSAGIGHSMQ